MVFSQKTTVITKYPPHRKFIIFLYADPYAPLLLHIHPPQPGLILNPWPFIRDLISFPTHNVFHFSSHNRPYPIPFPHFPFLVLYGPSPLVGGHRLHLPHHVVVSSRQPLPHSAPKRDISVFLMKRQTTVRRRVVAPCCWPSRESSQFLLITLFFPKSYCPVKVSFFGLLYLTLFF